MDAKTKKTTNTVKIVNIAVSIIIILLTVASITFILAFAKNYGEVIYLKMAIALLGMIFSGILLVCCYLNIKTFTHQEITFSLVPVFLFLTIFLSGVLDVLDGNPKEKTVIFIIQTAVAVFSVFIHVLFWAYQCSSLPKNKLQKYFTVFIMTLVGIYLALVVINLFSKFLFFADENGKLQYPGEIIEITLFSVLYLSYIVYVLLQRCSIRKKVSIACFAFFPLMFVVVTLVWYNYSESYNVSSLYFIFMLLATYVVFFSDYIESKQLLLKQKAELAENEHKQTELQTALMLSQIRPHFLYNAITAIRHLCKTDTKEAYNSLGLFSDYLRGNMDALSNGRIISFEKELEHIKTYLSLEQIRFGNELEVEYDIKYSNFSLPALTVQPIVENAVRHGATMNQDGGKIVITSKKTERGALITVTDNGPGFNADLPKDDGKNHFGLKNVRSCLEARQFGKMEIESILGKGTTVKIFIWGEEK